MSFSKQLKLLLHPYIFVLKEGKEFLTNPMSYDLMMLQISNEVIRSPKVVAEKEQEENAAKEIELLKNALPKAIERFHGNKANS